MGAEADLDLNVIAHDLTEAALGAVGDGLDNLAKAADEVGGRISSGFSFVGQRLSMGIGQAVDTLTTGGSLDQALLTLGGFMAGELTEQFLASTLERFAQSGLFAALAAPLGALGTAMGGIIAAAIPIGMAALPFILIGALIAAIALLIVNEDIRNKVIGFAVDVARNIGKFLGDALAALPKIVGDAFGAAWTFVLNAIPKFISDIMDFLGKLPERLAILGATMGRAILDGLSSLPGKLADLIANAFRSINIDVGPFHISGTKGVSIDLPDVGGLFSTGPAVTVPPGAPSGGGLMSVSLTGVSASELLDAIDEGMYFRLQRDAPADIRP